MKIAIKFTLVLTFWLGFAAVGLVFISSLAPETKFGHFTSKEEDPEPWFVERGLKTDFESVVDILLNHSNWEFRHQALSLLEKKSPKQSSEIFLKLAENDRNIYIRDAACTALVKLEDKRVIPPLKKLMEEVDSLSHKMDLAMFLSYFGDLSGFKYLLKAKDSPYNSDRYLSSKNISNIFKLRERIIEEHGVDPLRIYLQFAKDSYAPVRQNFVKYWPAEVAPEELMEKFTELAKIMAESDPDDKVRFFAKMRIGR